MNQLEKPFTLLRFFKITEEVKRVLNLFSVGPLIITMGIVNITAYDFLTKAQSPVRRVLNIPMTSVAVHRG